MATQSDTPSDKAKRAAAKKALKQRQQEADDQELIESTRRKFSSIPLCGSYSTITTKSLVRLKPKH
jgi:hypothetical protein